MEKEASLAQAELYLTPYYTPRSMPMPFELIGPFAGAEYVDEYAACDLLIGIHII